MTDYKGRAVPLPIKKGNQQIRLALIGLMLRGPITNLVNVLSLLFVGQKFAIFEQIMNIVCIAFFLIGLSELIKKFPSFVILTTAFFAILWIVTGFFYGGNVQYLQEYSKQFYIYVLPFCWIGYYLANSENFLDDFLKIARIKLILALFTQIIMLIFPRTDIFNNDYMNASNAMLVGILSVYYLSLRDRRRIDIVLSITSTVVILLCGSRGVFLCLCAFWIIHFLIADSKRKGIYIFGITFIGILFYFFSDSILGGLLRTSERIGYSSHLLYALTNTGIFDDSLRMGLIENFWHYLLQRPIGWGIFGDRYLSSSMHFWTKAIYPHNIILEILVQFGFFAGIPIIIWLSYKVIKAIKNKKEYYRYGIIILFCASIVRLMFSGSYWDDQMLFLLLGILLADSKFKIVI